MNKKQTIKVRTMDRKEFNKLMFYWKLMYDSNKNMSISQVLDSAELDAHLLNSSLEEFLDNIWVNKKIPEELQEYMNVI